MITSRERVIGIVTASKLGLRIIKEYPEVADMYRRGDSIRKIARELIIPAYGVSMSNARVAVHFVLAGYHPRGRDGGYDGLISARERKILEIQHRINGGYETVRLQTERGTNLQQTPQERVEYAGMGGRKAYEGKKGIHDPKNHGLCVILRGESLWTDEERAYVYDLSKKPEYQHPSRKGVVDLERLTKADNERFHQDNPRTKQAVAIVLSRERKKVRESISEILGIIKSIEEKYGKHEVVDPEKRAVLS